MVRNRSVQVRLTRAQYERLKNNCEIRGFRTLSDFVRFVALDQDLILQQRVHEIHEHLLGSMKKGKVRAKKRDV